MKQHIRLGLGFSVMRGTTIELIDIECGLGNLAGNQIGKEIALINPPYWICPGSGLREIQWGAFNFALINQPF